MLWLGLSKSFYAADASGHAFRDIIPVKCLNLWIFSFFLFLHTKERSVYKRVRGEKKERGVGLGEMGDERERKRAGETECKIKADIERRPLALVSIFRISRLIRSLPSKIIYATVQMSI